jgi:hypothetical protein
MKTIGDATAKGCRLASCKKKPRIFGSIKKICYFCSGVTKEKIMETRKFNNRSEQIEWYAQQRGWEPLTEEDKAALDDAVRMITNLD